MHGQKKASDPHFPKVGGVAAQPHVRRYTVILEDPIRSKIVLQDGRVGALD